MRNPVHVMRLWLSYLSFVACAFASPVVRRPRRQSDPHRSGIDKGLTGLELDWGVRRRRRRGRRRQGLRRGGGTFIGFALPLSIRPFALREPQPSFLPRDGTHGTSEIHLGFEK